MRPTTTDVARSAYVRGARPSLSAALSRPSLSADLFTIAEHLRASGHLLYTLALQLQTREKFARARRRRGTR